MGEDPFVAVAAAPADVWEVAGNENRLGEWSAEWRKHDPQWTGYSAKWTSRNKVLIKYKTDLSTGLRCRTGNWLAPWGWRRWQLELTRHETGTIITERFLGWRAGTLDMIRADLQRLKDIIEPPRPAHFRQTADMLALLGVYTTQFGSFTTMLWQVPALGLTAQAFLMTIALGSPISDDARIAAAALSVIIAWASQSLMHSQRGRAVNQAELAKRVSSKLAVDQFLGGDFALDDAVPKRTNARDIWDVDHQIYAIWRFCMIVFVVVDAVVILSVVTGWGVFQRLVRALGAV
jgi:hypothetical protein